MLLVLNLDLFLDSIFTQTSNSQQIICSEVCNALMREEMEWNDNSDTTWNI